METKKKGRGKRAAKLRGGVKKNEGGLIHAKKMSHEPYRGRMKKLKDEPLSKKGGRFFGGGIQSALGMPGGEKK